MQIRNESAFYFLSKVNTALLPINFAAPRVTFFLPGYQEEIESAAGQSEYLTHSSSFSTINLTFYQVLNEAAIDADKPSFAIRFTNAFQFGWNWIGELSIGIVSIWPLLLVVFTVFIFYKRSGRPKPKQA